MMKNLVLFVCLVCFSVPALALDETDGVSKDYFTISSVKVTDVTDSTDDKDLSSLDPMSRDGFFGDIISEFGDFIALGDKIMILVKKGRPVLNANFKQIRVLPRLEDRTLADTFYQMHSWSEPKSRTLRIEFENLMGASVVVFEFSVHFQHGGQFDGKGRYLSGVRVTPNNVDVSWGFKLDAKSVLVEVTNVGESRNDPVAGVTLEISYNVKSLLKEHLGGVTCFVAGDGRFRDVNH